MDMVGVFFGVVLSRVAAAVARDTGGAVMAGEFGLLTDWTLGVVWAVVVDDPDKDNESTSIGA